MAIFHRFTSALIGAVFRPQLSFRRYLLNCVRVGRKAAAIERAHPIAIPRVAGESGFRVTGEAGTHRRDLPEVCAILAIATFDTKPSLIIGIVRP